MERSPRRSRLAVMGALILLLLAASTAILYGFGYASKPAQVGEKVGPEVGSRAPDFELKRIDGGTLKLSDLRGKPVIVNFWATWCAPCELEMPNLQKYYEKYPGEFEIVAVNADESQRIVVKFIQDIRVTFPVVLDPGLRVSMQYRPVGLPTSYVIDSDGIVRAQQIGLMSEKKLAEYLKLVGVASD